MSLNNCEMRFAVVGQDQLTSNSWKMWTNKKGDAYISCRDRMREIKVSLHQSGQQLIAFTSESAPQTSRGSRFLQITREPDFYDGPEVKPSVSLFFPSWGLHLTPKMREADSKTWNGKVCLIKAAEEPLATVISFAIINAGIDLQSALDDEPSISAVTSFDVRLGKKLWVVRRCEPDGEMRQLATQAVNDRNGNRETAKILDEDYAENDFSMCVDGLNAEGIPFLMPFPTPIFEGGPATGRRLATPFIPAEGSSASTGS